MPFIEQANAGALILNGIRGILSVARLITADSLLVNSINLMASYT